MTHAPEDDRQSVRALALAEALRAVIGQLRRRLQDASHLAELTPSQVAVLRRLERDGPATVTALALAEGMRPQSMGANVLALKAAGWVSGAPDPQDRRQTILTLTEACRSRIDAGRLTRQDTLFRAIEAQLSADEQEELARAIGLLQRLAGA